LEQVFSIVTAVTWENAAGTTVAKQTRMKSTALKLAVLLSFTLALIGCASDPAVTTNTTTTATTVKTNKGPLERGNGLSSAMH
jgi:hypothetical protein